MWVDILKKSLQGRAFREFIEKRMNLTVDYEEKVHMKIQERPQEFLRQIHMYIQAVPMTATCHT